MRNPDADQPHGELAPRQVQCRASIPRMPPSTRGPHTGQIALAALGTTLIITDPSGSTARLVIRQRSFPTSRSSASIAALPPPAYPRSSFTGRPSPNLPMGREVPSMPAHDGVGRDEGEVRTPSDAESTHQRPQKLVLGAEPSLPTNWPLPEPR